MARIPLTRGQFAIVDPADFAILSKFKWCALKRPRGFEAVRNSPRGAGPRRLIAMHRQILGAGQGQIVDHQNHNMLDNRRTNLRFASKSQNAANRAGLDASNKSGIRGVSQSRSGKFRARIHVNGYEIHLGVFAHKKDARMAYSTANRDYFGEFGGKI